MFLLAPAYLSDLRRLTGGFPAEVFWRVFALDLGRKKAHDEAEHCHGPVQFLEAAPKNLRTRMSIALAPLEPALDRQPSRCLLHGRWNRRQLKRLVMPDVECLPLHILEEGRAGRGASG